MEIAVDCSRRSILLRCWPPLHHCFVRRASAAAAALQCEDIVVFTFANFLFSIFFLFEMFERVKFITKYSPHRIPYVSVVQRQEKCLYTAC